MEVSPHEPYSLAADADSGNDTYRAMLINQTSRGVDRAIDGTMGVARGMGGLVVGAAETFVGLFRPGFSYPDVGARAVALSGVEKPHSTNQTLEVMPLQDQPATMPQRVGEFVLAA